MRAFNFTKEISLKNNRAENNKNLKSPSILQKIRLKIVQIKKNPKFGLNNTPYDREVRSIFCIMSSYNYDF